MAKQHNRTTSAPSSRSNSGVRAARKRTRRRTPQSNGKARKLSRDTMLSRIKSPIRAVRDAGSSAASSVASYPMPAILIGAGLTWLLLQNRSIGSSSLARGARRLVSGVGTSVGEALSSTTGRSVESVRLAADSVRAGLSTLGAQAQSGASIVGEVVQQARRKASHGIEGTREFASDMWRDHPLAVAAAVMAAGVTTGMLLPATAREQRVMGKTASKVTRTVQRGGKRLLQQGRQLASESADAALREVRRQGLAPSELGRRVKRVVSKTKDAVVSSGE
jgi:hypothetical protein